MVTASVSAWGVSGRASRWGRGGGSEPPRSGCRHGHVGRRATPGSPCAYSSGGAGVHAEDEGGGRGEGAVEVVPGRLPKDGGHDALVVLEHAGMEGLLGFGQDIARHDSGLTGHGPRFLSGWVAGHVAVNGALGDIGVVVVQPPSCSSASGVDQKAACPSDKRTGRPRRDVVFIFGEVGPSFRGPTSQPSPVDLTTTGPPGSAATPCAQQEGTARRRRPPRHAPRSRRGVGAGM